MFSKFYARRAKKVAQPEPVEFFPYIVRDSITHNVIAKGTREKCEAYVNSFGNCYVEGA